MKLIMMILILCASLFAQVDQNKTEQKTQSCFDMQTIERFESLRVLPPLSILNFEGNKIDYVIEAERVLVGSLLVVPKSEIPTDFAKIYKQKKWWVAYCATDNTVLFIQDYQLSVEALTKSKKVTKKGN